MQTGVNQLALIPGVELPIACRGHANHTQRKEINFVLCYRLRPQVADFRAQDENAYQHIQGDLGRATVLDESVNRPGHVSDDVAASLDHLYATYPTTPRNPAEWGQNRATLEGALIEHYGVTRRMATPGGVPVAPARYQNLEATLG